MRSELSRVDFRRRLYHRRHPARVRDVRQRSECSRSSPGSRLGRRLGAGHDDAWPRDPKPRYDHHHRQDDGVAAGWQRRASARRYRPKAVASRCALSCCLPGARRYVPPEAHVLVHQIWLGKKRKQALESNYSAEELNIVQRDIGRLAQYTMEMGGSGELLETALRDSAVGAVVSAFRGRTAAHEAHHGRGAVRAEVATAAAGIGDIAGDGRPAWGCPAAIRVSVPAARGDLAVRGASNLPGPLAPVAAEQLRVVVSAFDPLGAAGRNPNVGQWAKCVRSRPANAMRSPA